MSVPAVEAVNPTAKRNVPQLQPRKMKQAEFVRTVYDVQCERDIEAADLLAEGYWAHVAEMLRPGDRIEVHPEDNAFFAELIVLGRGKLWAQVELIRYVQLNKDREQRVDSEFRHEWSGSHTKYRVLRGSDVVKENLETEEAAARWIKSHEEAMSH